MGCFGVGDITLAKRATILRNTPLSLVSSDDSTFAELVATSFVIHLRKNKALELPASMGDGGFLVCVRGELIGTADGGDYAPFEHVRKAGDFWWVSQGSSQLTASKKVQILCVPQAAFEQNALLHEVSHMDILQTMRSIPYFETLDAVQLSSLGSLFTFSVYPQSTAIYSRGELADRFYLLVHGEVAMLTDDGTVVYQCKAGAFFGGTALLLGSTAKRTYTVSPMKGPCAVLSLARAQFDLFAERFGAVAEEINARMLRETTGRMFTSAMTSAKLSPETTLEERGLIQRHMKVGERVRIVRVEAGQVVQAVGDLPSHVLFLYSGRLVEASKAIEGAPAAKEKSRAVRKRAVSVELGGNQVEGVDESFSKPKRPSERYADAPVAAEAPGTWSFTKGSRHGEDVKVLSPGAYVGEQAVLFGRVRDTAIVAQVDSTALAVDREHFASILELFPALYADVVLRNVVANRVPLSSCLDHPAGSIALLAHLKKDLAEESFNFWVDSKAWRTSADAAGAGESPKSAALRERAAQLVKIYIGDGAEQQINVPSGMAKAVLKKVDEQRDGVDAALFDECRHEIYTLLQRDALPRFVAAEPAGGAEHGGGMKALRAKLDAHADDRCIGGMEAFAEALDKARSGVPLTTDGTVGEHGMAPSAPAPATNLFGAMFGGAPISSSLAA